MRKRLFFCNAAIMTVTSLLLRTIGIFFRIYVSNRVGAEGMGLYQLILSVYILASSFAVSGLTTAVTRLCTDELAYGSIKRVRKTLYIAIAISVAIGLISGLILCFGADTVADVFLHDPRAVPSLRILTVSLPFMGASSCIKGYFMARRKVTSSSVAQILEQLVRIGVIVALLEYTNADSVEETCFAVLLGDSVAEGTSCLFMAACYIIDRVFADLPSHSSHTVSYRISKRLLAIALPITGGRYLSSGLRTIENVIVPNTLTHYTASREVSLSQFGKLKGMAMPLIFFPSSFLSAFSTLLIPEISEAKALNQTRRLQSTIERAVYITLLSSYWISGILSVTAFPLGMMIYNDKEVGWLLALLAPLAPVMYTESVVVSILKGLDQQTHSLLYSTIDSGCRIILILSVVPFYGIVGFYGIMVFSNLLTCILNLYRLCKVSDLHIPVSKWFVKPLLAMTVAVGLIFTMNKYNLFSAVTPMGYCLSCALLITLLYGALSVALGCIGHDEFTVVYHPKAQKKSG